jgi:hypothetical protein
MGAASFSSARTTKRFPSSRCASAIEIVRPFSKRFEFFARIASHFPLRRKSMISLAKGGRVSRHVIWIALVMLSLPPVMAKRYSGPEITAAFVFAPMIH